MARAMLPRGAGAAEPEEAAAPGTPMLPRGAGSAEPEELAEAPAPAELAEAPGRPAELAEAPGMPPQFSVSSTPSWSAHRVRPRGLLDVAPCFGGVRGWPVAEVASGAFARPVAPKVTAAGCGAADPGRGFGTGRNGKIAAWDGARIGIALTAAAHDGARSW
jgi:hypothetical protein